MEARTTRVQAQGVVVRRRAGEGRNDGGGERLEALTGQVGDLESL
jgi:hypothetical protein